MNSRDTWIEDDAVAEVIFRGHKITSADAADFLNLKDCSGGECPVCSTVDWLTAFSQGGSAYTAIPSYVDDEDGQAFAPEPLKRLPLYTVICANCGYARFHSLVILWDWVVNQNKGKGKE